MNVKEALRTAQAVLTSDSPKIDTEILLASTLEKNLTWLKTWPDYILSSTELDKYNLLVERRVAGEPVAYIIGERGFWTLCLKTNASTLIPRPETELLVELALQFLKKFKQADVIDLGTGTGAIALAIASERPNDRVCGCDFSEAAIRLAEENAVFNDILNTRFFQSNWFSNVKNSLFQLIISNPPYIDKDDPHLEQGDVVFEPNSALISLESGYADIKKIILSARDYLAYGGCLMLEHGFEQAEVVRGLLLKAGYSDVYSAKDLVGIERATVGRFFSDKLIGKLEGETSVN